MATTIKCKIIIPSWYNNNVNLTSATINAVDEVDFYNVLNYRGNSAGYLYTQTGASTDVIPMVFNLNKKAHANCVYIHNIVPDNTLKSDFTLNFYGANAVYNKNGDENSWILNEYDMQYSDVMELDQVPDIDNDSFFYTYHDIFVGQVFETEVFNQGKKRTISFDQNLARDYKYTYSADLQTIEELEFTFETVTIDIVYDIIQQIGSMYMPIVLLVTDETGNIVRESYKLILNSKSISVSEDSLGYFSFTIKGLRIK